MQVFIGNGLRANIWRDFTTRFNIPIVREFYGATEGNCNVINLNNQAGCIGYVPIALPEFLRNLLLLLYVIRVDPVTLEPIRDSQGLCIVADPGGQFLLD